MNVNTFDIECSFSTIIDYAPYILAILGIIVITLYSLTYLDRYFKYLKVKERKYEYIDERTFDLIYQAYSYIVLITVIISLMYIASMASPLIKTETWLFIRYTANVFLAIIILLITATITRIVGKIMDHLIKTARVDTKAVLRTRMLLIMDLLLRYMIYLIGGLIALLILLTAADLGPHLVIGIEEFIEASLPDIFLIIFLLIITYFISKFIGSILEDIKKHSTKFAPPVIDVYKTGLRYGLYLIVTAILISILLGMAGLAQAGLMVILTFIFVIAVLVVLILSTPLKNIVSGFVLMNSDPIDEGDRVKIVDDLVCDVLEMNPMFMRVRTLRGEVIDIPNDEVISKKIVNFSRSNEYAMSVVATVDFDIPHQRVEKIMLEAAEKTDGIVNEPLPEVYGKEIDGNTIRHELLAYTRTPEKMKKIKSELIYNIQELFHKNGMKVLISEK